MPVCVRSWSPECTVPVEQLLSSSHSPPADAEVRPQAYRFKDTGGSRDTHETDTRTSQTNLKTNPTHRLTRQRPDHTRTPGHTRRPTPHHSPASAVVVTVMATAPGRKKTSGGAGTHTGHESTGKKTPGEPGHTRDTHGTRGRTRAHGTRRQISQPSKPPTTHPHDHATAETVAGSTSAGQAPVPVSQVKSSLDS